MKQAAALQKGRADQQAQGEVLSVGQHVYLRNHCHRGRNKIQDAWAPDVFQVVRPPKQGGTVYAVAPQHKLTEVRHVHRSMLKPVPASNVFLSPVERHSPTTTSFDTEEQGLWVAVRRASGPENAQPVHTRTPPELDPVRHSAVPAAGPPEASAGTSSSAAPCPEMVRKSTCETAGKHSNLHHLPATVRSRANGATNSQILGSSVSTPALFRPWSPDEVCQTFIVCFSSWLVRTKGLSVFRFPL